MADSSQFDLMCIGSLKEDLKWARLEYHMERMEAEKADHRLLQEIDRFAGSSEIQHERAVRAREKRQQHYNCVFAIHKKRIQCLIEDIERESACRNWQDMTLSELLIRWSSGQLCYGIFQSVEPALKVIEAFEKLEFDLLPPPLGVVLHVSAQVAAGWYARPIDSPFWPPRTPRSLIEESTSSASSIAVSGDLHAGRMRHRTGVETHDRNFSLEMKPYNMKHSDMVKMVNTAKDYKGDDRHIGEQCGVKQAHKTGIGENEIETYGLEEFAEDEYSDEEMCTGRTRQREKWVPLVYGRRSRMIKATEYME